MDLNNTKNPIKLKWDTDQRETFQIKTWFLKENLKQLWHSFLLEIENLYKEEGK